MGKEVSQKEKLEEILKSGSYSKLRSFKSPKKWNGLSQDERELLCFLFVKQAERFLAVGDKRADESFAVAFRILPGDPRVYFRQGVAYCNHPDHQYLEEAALAFSKATTLDSHFHDAWRGWASVLFRMGTLYEKPAYFAQSDEKFCEAEKNQPDKALDYQFYWQWGVCWYQSGRMSGEALDFSNALDKMIHAATLPVDDADFWNDFGNIYVEQFSLLGTLSLLSEAIDKYKRAVELKPEFCEGWFNLGAAYHRLYELSQKETHRTAACECYSNAILIRPEHHVTWGKWGQLLAWAGKFGRHLPWLVESCEKFEKAIEIREDHPVILASWAESLLLIGGHREDLNLLKLAEEKLDRAIRLRPKDPDLWCLYGECYNELGRYFQDKEYYQQAIEKFQHGLTLHQTHFMLWFGIGLTYLALGEQEENKNYLEKAVLFFSRVAEFCKEAPPLFWCQWGIAFRRLAHATGDRRYAEAALKKFEKAVSLFPPGAPVNADCLYEYACMCDVMGDFDEDSMYYEKAIDILKQIVDQDATFLPARHHLALCYSHLAEATTEVEIFGLAHEQFQHLLAQDPENGLVWNDWGYTILTLSYIVHDTSKPDQTKILFEQAQKKLMQAAALGENQAYYNLACLHSLKGDDATCIRFLERAQRADSLPPIDVILEDEWLDNIKKRKAFDTFFNRLHSNP